MKEINKDRAMKIALDLATWTEDLSDIVEVLAILVRIFCFRTYEEVKRVESGEKLGDLQDAVFEAGRRRREKIEKKTMKKRTEYL